MSKRKFWLVSLLITTLAAPVAALQIGDPAPQRDVKMRNVDGRELSIAEIAGKDGTLVIFTCNHCPWSKAWETRIVALGNTYQQRGIGVKITTRAADLKFLHHLLQTHLRNFKSRSGTKS